MKYIYFTIFIGSSEKIVEMYKPYYYSVSFDKVSRIK